MNDFNEVLPSGRCHVWKDKMTSGVNNKKNAKIIHDSISEVGVTIFMVHLVNYFHLVLPKYNKNDHCTTYSLPRFSYIKIEIDRFNVSWKLEQ